MAAYSNHILVIMPQSHCKLISDELNSFILEVEGAV